MVDFYEHFAMSKYATRESRQDAIARSWESIQSQLAEVTRQRDSLLSALLDEFPYEKHKEVCCDCSTCVAIANVKGE